MIPNSKQSAHCFWIDKQRLATIFGSMLLMITTWTWSPSSHAQTMDNRMFAAAMAHIEIKEWPQAEGLLKFLLSENPQMHRARLELGLVYLKMGNTEKAHQQFEVLLSKTDVPENVKQNIRQMMSQSAAASQPEIAKSANIPATDAEPETNQSYEHLVQGSLQLSVGYDDNVRYSSADYFLEEDPFLDGVFLELDDGELVYVAPDGFVYDIDGNLLFENDGFVDFGSPDSSNRFLEARLNLNHEYRFSSMTGLTWHNKLSLQNTDNHEHSQYNKTQVRLETGLSQRISDSWKWSVIAHHRLLERDGQVQIRAWGIDPELTYYNNWGSWTLGFEWMDRQYEDSIIVTGDIETFYFGFSSTIREISAKWSKLFWDNDLLLLAKFEYSDNNADDDFNYKGTRYTFASVYDFHTDWSLLLSATRFRQDYSEVSDGPLDDTSTSFRAKLTYSLNDSIDLFLAGERALRTSDVYGGIKSDKSLVQLGAEVAF